MKRSNKSKLNKSKLTSQVKVDDKKEPQVTEEHLELLQELVKSKNSAEGEYTLIGKMTMELNNRLENLKIYERELKDKESEIIVHLESIYGKVNIDLTTGVITNLETEE